MRYFLADIVPSADGWRPALPDDLPFLLLAEPGCRDAPWGLYEASVESAEELPGVEPLPAELTILVESARGYPPALALAREQMAARYDGETPTRVDFLAQYAEALRAHLRSQPTSGFFLAEALAEEVGYLDVGGFYWVLSCNDATVRWVSDDYHVYASPRGAFAIERR